MKRDRYEVRPDGDRFIIWDNETGEQAKDNVFRFTLRQFAQSSADKMNGER